MSMLSNMKSEGLEGQEDRLGGFQLKTTDLYPAKIKLAYLVESKKGAYGLNLIFSINNADYRERTIWFTNQNKENYYFTKDDKGNATKTKAQLPGFVLVNNLCRLAIGKELHEIQEEEKVIKVYDADEKKEIPKAMPVLTELHGAEVLLAIVEKTVNKTVLNDNTGKYDAIAETTEQNEIEHVFHLETRASMNEVDAYTKAENEGKTPPPFDFANQWEERYKGKKRDARTIRDGDTPKSGRPAASGNAGASKTESKPATSSLFKR